MKVLSKQIAPVSVENNAYERYATYFKDDDDSYKYKKEKSLGILCK